MVTASKRRVFTRLISVMAALAAASPADFGWREALPGYRYQFPRDHFEHPDFRTEWWYYTGTLTDPSGRRFGFELVFFREGQRAMPENPSAWAIRDLYLAHAALTDVAGRHFWYDERLNRAGPGIAGASFQQRRIWNGNWKVEWHGEQQTLDAVTENFRFHLALEPLKPYVIEGENGVSRAEGPGRASYYVSFPRLRTSGTITLSQAASPVEVHGAAWMDHQWFSGQLAPYESGWDWFSIQLDNNTELMLFELRRKDGSIDPYSSGTFIDASGAPHYLKHADFILEPLEYWGKYPVRWRIRIPVLGMNVYCKAVLDDQELRARNGGMSYWEGAVDYSGTHYGLGYLEMTGYRGPATF